MRHKIVTVTFKKAIMPGLRVTRGKGMFATEMEETYSFGGWAVQQVLSVLVPLLLAAVSGGLAEDFLPNYRMAKVFDTYDGLIVSGLAFLYAVLVHRIFPRASTTGSWVWVLPSLLFLFVLIAEAIASSFTHALSVLLGPIADGEAGALTVLVTYPTCATLSYSITMLFLARKARLHQGSETP